MGNWSRELPATVPGVLYHHTSLACVKLIVCDDKYISLLLGSNLKKNDDKELVLGKRLFNAILHHMDDNKQRGLLHQVCDLDTSFSVSFTELLTTDHMMNFYGNEDKDFCARLEFDLTNYKTERVEMCTYTNPDEIDELARLFTSELDDLFKITKDSSPNQKIDRILAQTALEWDILSKVATTKFSDEWSEEKEWRIVKHSTDANEVIHTGNGKDGIILHLPVSHLTGVTLLYRKEKSKELLTVYKNLKNYKRWSGNSHLQIRMRKFKDNSNS